MDLIEEYLQNIIIINSMTLDDSGDKKKVKKTNKLATSNRKIATAIEQKHPELKERFSDLLLSSDINIKDTVAHHILEVMTYDKKIRFEALRTIEYISKNHDDSIQRLGNSMWLKDWYAKHPDMIE